MEIYHYVWILAGLTGLVAGGLAGSGWAIFAGSAPRPGMFYRYDVLTPLKVIVMVFYAPLGVVRVAFGELDRNPFFGLPLLALGLGWSFLQGVFILSTFFGFT